MTDTATNPTPNRRGTPRAVAVGLAAFAIAATAHADTGRTLAPVRLLDRSLAERPALLVSLDADSMVIADSVGRTVAADPNDFIAVFARDHDRGVANAPSSADDDEGDATVAGLPPGLTVGPAAEPVRTRWMLTLTDAQSVLGMPGSPSEPDVLSFRSDRLGPIEVPLERVAAVRLIESAADALAPAMNATRDDTVNLANGDSVRGFILELTPSVVAIETANGVAELDLGLVRSVRFANPSERSSRPMVRLGSGEQFAVEPASPGPGRDVCVLVEPDLRLGSARVDDDRDLGGPPDPSSFGESTSADRVAASICLNPAEIRSLVLPTRGVIPLASIAPSRVRPAEGRRRTNPPQIEPEATARLAPSVVLPGPMTVAWPLPASARAVAFDVRLGATLAAEDAPPGPWGDAVVRVRVNTSRGPQTIAEHRLWYDQGAARVAAPLPEPGADNRELVIEVDPGPSGPIQDRVLLVRPVLIAD